MVAKRLFLSVLCLLFIALLTSCYGSWNPFDPDNNVDNRFDKLNDVSEIMPESVKDAKETYSVIVLADLHYGSIKNNNPEEKLFKWLDSKKMDKYFPRFALVLGDIADTGSQVQYDDYLIFCKKLKDVYGIDTINVPGNHDLYQSHWDVWQKNCFPYESFYYFKTDKFSWYAIDTSSGSLGERQYNQLKEAFEKDPNPKIVYSHYPILEFHLVFGLCDTIERNYIIDLFTNNNVICSLGGHLHYNAEEKIVNCDEVCLPSFRYKEAWGLLTVVETEETTIYEEIK